MCKCTPNIRTPFCGRGDCVSPAQAKPEDARMSFPGGWQNVVDGLHSRVQQQITRITELETQNAELAKDAGRWRKFREMNWHNSPIVAVMGPKMNVRLGTDCPSVDRLDDIIDAALASQKGEKM